MRQSRSCAGHGSDSRKGKVRAMMVAHRHVIRCSSSSSCSQLARGTPSQHPRIHTMMLNVQGPQQGNGDSLLVAECTHSPGIGVPRHGCGGGGRRRGRRGRGAGRRGRGREGFDAPHVHLGPVLLRNPVPYGYEASLWCEAVEKAVVRQVGPRTWREWIPNAQCRTGYHLGCLLQGVATQQVGQKYPTMRRSLSRTAGSVQGPVSRSPFCPFTFSGVTRVVHSGSRRDVLSAGIASWYDTPSVLYSSQDSSAMPPGQYRTL